MAYVSIESDDVRVYLWTCKPVIERSTAHGGGAGGLTIPMYAALRVAELRDSHIHAVLS